MKTAVLISGQIRNAKECYPSLYENIIKPYQADVFIDSWLPNNYTLDHRGQYIPNDMSVDDVLREYRPKLATFEDFDNSKLVQALSKVDIQNRKAYDGSWAQETIIPNIFYMYYKVWRCFDLMKNYESLNETRYDLVFRMRFDLQFDSFPVHQEIAPNSVYVPEGFDHRGGLNDLMAFGDNSSMEKYCLLFPSLFNYANSGMGFHPESILRQHLEIGKTKVERFSLKYKLRGEYV
jgi:hypothetical protein